MGSRSNAPVRERERPRATRRDTAVQNQTAKGTPVEAAPAEREHEQKNSPALVTKKPTKSLPPRGYYTMQEAAAQCGLSEKTIYREIRRKRLHANKMGRQVRIAHADWQRYLVATGIGA